MNTLHAIRGGVVAALLATGGAYAQSLTPVMTDVNPLPAEDRASVGAVVIENSMVRAQRQALAVRYNPDVAMKSASRGTERTARSARAKEDLAQDRDDAAMRLHEMGAGSLTPR